MGKDLSRHFSEDNVQMANKQMKRCSVSLIIRNVWIKATMRYHFTPISIPLLKKKKKKKKKVTSVGKDVETWKSCALLMWMWNDAATVENGFVVPQRIQHRIIIWCKNSSAGYIPERFENRVSERHLYSQKPKGKSNPVSINRWVEKQCGLFIW